MLSGIDISHHNQYMKDPNAIAGVEFVIMKASEGKGFKDGAVKKYVDILTSNKKQPLIGFYHFARPEMNPDYFDEVKNFISAVIPYLKLHPVLALDVEARALEVPFLDTWCLEWCKCVYNILGIKPMIYCSAAETKRFKKCADFGCGLWVAKWSDKISKRDIKPWEFWAIWQNSNNKQLSGVRVDTDVFNGTKDQFLKYAEVSEDGEERAQNDRATDNAKDKCSIQEGKD